MRAIICGGRDFTDYRKFALTMQTIDAPITVVIQGGAKGADWCAYLWANSPTGARQEIIFKADWVTHGKSAGPIRNQRMLDEGKPDIVIAFPGGRGTADMARRAEKMGVKVIRVGV